MGNPDREQSRGLTVLFIGSADLPALAPLQARVPALQVRELALPASVALERHPEAVNRGIDAAPSHWIVIVRRGEQIDEQLAEEIIASAIEPPLSWGFRIETDVLYRNKPLRLGRDRGEIRLFHRRHARFDLRARGNEIKVQGTVLRSRHAFVRSLHGSAREHAESLAVAGIPHSLLRRALLFARRAVETGSWWRSANTLRYLWIEAGYDRGETSDE
jgi:hypothetical protein